MIGFDIGGTKCSVAIGKSDGDNIKILNKKVIATDHSVSPYEMIDRLCLLAEEMTDDFSKIGISCGGPLNSKDGIIMSPPNLPGWDNVKIIDYLKDRYKCVAVLQNDANACAVAEWKFGAGRGCENMVFLTFGSGLGAGLILNGRLYTGASDMAGEVGHIRLLDDGPIGYGKAGSFEGFCSGNGIAALGRMVAIDSLKDGKTLSYCKSKADIDGISAKSIAECAKQGFEDAMEVYRICGERLGRGLSVIIDMLNPEMIVIGSVFQRCEELLRDSMERVIKKETLSCSRTACKIVPAMLKEELGDYAALSLVAD